MSLRAPIQERPSDGTAGFLQPHSGFRFGLHDGGEEKGVTVWFAAEAVCDLVREKLTLLHSVQKSDR